MNHLRWIRVFLITAFTFSSGILQANSEETTSSFSYGTSVGLLGGGFQPTLGLFAEKQMSERFSFGPFLLIQPHLNSTLWDPSRKTSYAKNYVGLDFNYHPVSPSAGFWIGMNAGFEFCVLQSCSVSPVIGPAIGYDFKISNSLTLSPEISIFHRMSGLNDNFGGISVSLKGL